ncbi:MAG: hypothetical protein WBO82_00365 [Neisseria sp.]|jgi:hypothetical protein
MNTKQKILLAVFLLLFAAVKMFGLAWWKEQQPDVTVVNTACDLRQGCTLPNGVQVLFGSLTTKMPFDMRAQNVPADVKNISVSFSMRDMDMGFNRYDLAKQLDKSWYRAANRLPVCAQGRHDWLADITVDETVFQVAFEAE